MFLVSFFMIRLISVSCTFQNDRFQSTGHIFPERTTIAVPILQEAGMGLHCLTCYETVAHPEIMANLRTLVENKWVSGKDQHNHYKLDSS